jgi:predicted DNA-binding transcriptional regulator AlpA
MSTRLEVKMTNYGVVTIKKFAESIGKPVSTVYSWKKRGHMPKECFKTIGRSVFVKEQATLEWLLAA